MVLSDLMRFRVFPRDPRFEIIDHKSFSLRKSAEWPLPTPNSWTIRYSVCDGDSHSRNCQMSKCRFFAHPDPVWASSHAPDISAHQKSRKVGKDRSSPNPICRSLAETILELRLCLELRSEGAYCRSGILR